MKLERALVVSSMLVALSGIAALALTFETAPWLTLPAAALTVLLAARPGLTARLALPEKLLTPLALAAAGFSVVDFLYIGGSLVAAGADLMLLLLCMKALSLRGHKDYVQLYAAAFFLLLASTALSTEIYFLAPFVAFFVSLTWALMLLTVKGEAGSAPSGRAGFTFGGAFFGGTALLTLCSFIVTLAIFFAIPRVGIGFMSRRAGGLLRTSGFSDTVDIGSMGGIKLDPTVVMRVRLPGFKEQPDIPLYWRGRTFDRYDGRAWSESSRTRTGAFRVRGDIYLRQGIPPGDPLVQEVALEPLDTPTLFALGQAYLIRSDFNMVYVGRAGEIFLPYPPGRRLHYTVYSVPGSGEYLPDDLPGGRYLQLPEGSETVHATSARAAPAGAGPREIARSIEGYLAANQTYSLEPRPERSMSPIDDFLSGSRQGYCEHFATAMTLMLRSRGVHARMVSGFSGGEWNGYGGYLLVREQDAHTWVEAYMPGEGWTVFDPTPAATSGAASSARLGEISGALDYLRYRWDRYIVYYNLRDQLAAAGYASDAWYGLKRYLSDAGSSVTGRFTGAGPGALRGGLAYALAVSALLLAAAGLWLAVRRLARARRGTGTRGAVRFYNEMQRLLGRAGYKRPGGATPREFARGLPSGPEGPGEGVSLVTELYYRVRYRGGRLTGAERKTVDEVLAGLKGRRAGR